MTTPQIPLTGELVASRGGAEIDADLIPDDAIDTAQIADGAITSAKLANSVRTQIASGGTTNAVSLNTDAFTASDDGVFPAYKHANRGWVNGSFNDANGVTWRFNETLDHWEADPSGAILKPARAGDADRWPKDKLPTDTAYGAIPDVSGFLTQSQVDARAEVVDE